LHYLENPKIIGLKPYHVFSNQKPTFDSTISGFLPEWAWEIADERGLIITLHMVKDLAIADPLNQKEIQMMCTKYPNAKLVLAHAARCFHAPNARKGLKSLHGLENVWFDMAAICEVEPIIEIISEFGSKKLMWGSDFPVCMIRGRAVTLGMNFIWLQNDTIRWDLNTNCNPVLVGLESLRALETAVYETSLKNEDVKNMFFNNAADLLGIGKTNNKILQ
jgi:glutamate-1-semialdehyde 2,1-aminomutase